MRKIYLTVLLLSTFAASQAQFTGKPIYNIEVRRADTLMGNIEVEMFPLIAPLHVENWDSIVTSGGYDSTAFHRVVPGFVIQGGDPNSVSGPVSTWGTGNANQATVPAEFSEVPHARGILSAARSNDPNSATSQFFICVANAFSLDNDYSVYGEVRTGMDVADMIVAAPTSPGTERPADKISMFITRTGSNDSVPEAPVLNAPAVNATNVSASTSFSWSSIGDAKLYKIEVASDAAFTSIVYTRDTKNTSVFVPGLDGFTNYYWRVRANNGGHLSVSPEERMFTSGIGAPTLTLPADSSYTSDRPFFDWEDATNATKYRFQMSTMASFANPFLNVYDTLIENVSEFKGPSQLVLNTRYYWRVLSVDASGNESVYSDTWEFTPNEIAAVAEWNDEISLYPNPAYDHVTLTLDHYGVFTLYHVDGRLMKEENLRAGTHLLDVHDLPQGLYFYTLKSENDSFRGKLIKK